MPFAERIARELHRFSAEIFGFGTEKGTRGTAPSYFDRRSYAIIEIGWPTFIGPKPSVFCLLSTVNCLLSTSLGGKNLCQEGVQKGMSQV
jgi:hypothetical protein